jgi:hypothetical protein
MLTILYRACDKELEQPPKREGRPHWFSKINNFKSIHASIQNSKYKNSIKLITLMDGNSSTLSDFITSLNYEIIFTKTGSNNDSLKYQLNYAKDLDTDLYFLEDDYLHTENAITHIINGISKFGLVTGYDHYDRYSRNDDITMGCESIYFHEGLHWRTCESTTCTWAVKKDIFKNILPIAENFLLHDREFFRFLNRNNIKLYSPIPALSTHVHEPYMSPGIDWEKIATKEI